MPETIQAYLDTVREQIRWKRARSVLIQELERHLEDQRDDFLKAGRSPEEAERLAIEDMGDPVTVGAELDAVHRPKPQWGLLGLTAALAVAGAVLRVVFRQVSGGLNTGQADALGKALASLGLGTAAMLGMYFLDVSRLARHGKALYIGTLLLGMGMFWRSVSQMFFMSSGAYYFAQFLPVLYALWIYAWRNSGWKGFFLVIAGGVPLAVICTIRPSATNLILFLLSGFVLTLLAVWQDWFGIGRRKGLGVLLGIAFGLLAYLFFQGYFAAFYGRLQIALHPEMDALCRGFMGQILQTFWQEVPPLRQYGSVGAAVQAGAQIRVYYPEGAFISQEMMPIDYSHDFLPLSMAVQCGWVPLLLLLAALAALLVWMLAKGLRQTYLLGRFVVLAVVMTLAVQLLFSTALNAGFVLFSAGMPLVVGNLQTVVDMALIGLALSVFREESIGREEPAGPLPRRKRLRVRFEYQ